MISSPAADHLAGQCWGPAQARESSRTGQSGAASSAFSPASFHLLDVDTVGLDLRCRYVFIMGGEPAIVVEDRKELTYLLCQAAELEHAVMCQYLYAAVSLKSTEGPGLREDQGRSRREAPSPPSQCESRSGARSDHWEDARRLAGGRVVRADSR